MTEHIGINFREESPVPKKQGRMGIMWKLGIITVLILMMLIPLSMVGGLINERQLNQERVEQEIATSWGAAQTLTGPVLAVPYVVKDSYKDPLGNKTDHVTRKTAYLLPTEFSLMSRLNPQVRQKGIFRTNVYTTDVTSKGHFNLDKLKELKIPEQDYRWDDAYVVLGITDVLGLNAVPKFSLQGKSLALRPGVNGANLTPSGLYSLLKISRDKPVVPFNLSMSIKGTKSLSVIPVGQQSTLTMTSDWDSPRFYGDVLPTKPEVSDSGFKAVWNIPDLARNYGQTFTSDTNMQRMLSSSQIGVELMTPVDFYRQVDRAIKYGVLFLVLTFATYFIFETISDYRLHPFQYLLIGCSITLFYLLLLAFAEVIGFGGAYTIASVGTIASISLYSRAILGKVRKGAPVLIGGLLSTLYGYLYVLLQLEDWSLMFGAIGLFAVLAAVMYVTRNVDWYNEQPA